MNEMHDHLRQGRETYTRHAWHDAYHAFLCADEATSLEADDLERLPTAAYLIGRELEFIRLIERLHQIHLEADNSERAEAFFSEFEGLIQKKEKIKMTRLLPLRITLIKPPAGVPFCLQQGKDDLVPPSSDSGENTSFDFTVNIVNERTGGRPNFRGPFVQGPPAGRFIYINSGTYAGQSDSCWSRRAKIPLSGITWELIEEALSKSSVLLEARISGTAGDGGPACATVQLLNGGWKIQKKA